MKFVICSLILQYLIGIAIGKETLVHKIQFQKLSDLTNLFLIDAKMTINLNNIFLNKYYEKDPTLGEKLDQIPITKLQYIDYELFGKIDTYIQQFSQDLLYKDYIKHLNLLLKNIKNKKICRILVENKKQKKEQTHFLVCLKDDNDKSDSILKQIQLTLENNFAHQLKDSDLISIPKPPHEKNIPVLLKHTVEDSEFQNGCLTFLDQAYFTNKECKEISSNYQGSMYRDIDQCDIQYPYKEKTNQYSKDCCFQYQQKFRVVNTNYTICSPKKDPDTCQLESRMLMKNLLVHCLIQRKRFTELSKYLEYSDMIAYLISTGTIKSEQEFKEGALGPELKLLSEFMQKQQKELLMEQLKQNQAGYKDEKELMKEKIDSEFDQLTDPKLFSNQNQNLNFDGKDSPDNLKTLEQQLKDSDQNLNSLVQQLSPDERELLEENLEIINNVLDVNEFPFLTPKILKYSKQKLQELGLEAYLAMKKEMEKVNKDQKEFNLQKEIEPNYLKDFMKNYLQKIGLVIKKAFKKKRDIFLEDQVDLNEKQKNEKLNQMWKQNLDENVRAAREKLKNEVKGAANEKLKILQLQKQKQGMSDSLNANYNYLSEEQRKLAQKMKKVNPNDPNNDFDTMPNLENAPGSFGKNGRQRGQGFNKDQGNESDEDQIYKLDSKKMIKRDENGVYTYIDQLTGERIQFTGDGSPIDFKCLGKNPLKKILEKYKVVDQNLQKESSLKRENSKNQLKKQQEILQKVEKIADEMSQAIKNQTDQKGIEQKNNNNITEQSAQVCTNQTENQNQKLQTEKTINEEQLNKTLQEPVEPVEPHIKKIQKQYHHFDNLLIPVQENKKNKNLYKQDQKNQLEKEIQKIQNQLANLGKNGSSSNMSMEQQIQLNRYVTELNEKKDQLASIINQNNQKNAQQINLIKKMLENSNLGNEQQQGLQNQQLQNGQWEISKFTGGKLLPLSKLLTLNQDKNCDNI